MKQLEIRTEGGIFIFLYIPDNESPSLVHVPVGKNESFVVTGAGGDVSSDTGTGPGGALTLLFFLNFFAKEESEE